MDGDRLHVEAPAGTLTPEVLDALREAKPALLAALQGAAAPGAPFSVPESLPPVRETRRPTWADLSPGERRIIAKARDAYPADFDSLLLRYFAEGMITGEAEIQVVMDLIDRDLGIDRGKDPPDA